MVTSLPPDFFAFLSDLQRNLCRVIKFVGRIEHDLWRSFMNERKTEAMEVCINFVFVFILPDLKKFKRPLIVTET